MGCVISVLGLNQEAQQLDSRQSVDSSQVLLLWMCRFIRDVLCLSWYELINLCCSVVDHISVFHYFILSFLSFFLFPLSVLFHDWQRAFLVNEAIFHLISTSSSSSSSSTSLRVLPPKFSITPSRHFSVAAVSSFRLMVKPTLESDLGWVLILFCASKK